MHDVVRINQLSRERWGSHRAKRTKTPHRTVSRETPLTVTNSPSLPAGSDITDRRFGCWIRRPCRAGRRSDHDRTVDAIENALPGLGIVRTASQRPEEDASSFYGCGAAAGTGDRAAPGSEASPSQVDPGPRTHEFSAMVASGEVTRLASLDLPLGCWCVWHRSCLRLVARPRCVYRRPLRTSRGACDRMFHVKRLVSQISQADAAGARMVPQSCMANWPAYSALGNTRGRPSDPGCLPAYAGTRTFSECPTSELQKSRASLTDDSVPCFTRCVRADTGARRTPESEVRLTRSFLGVPIPGGGRLTNPRAYPDDARPGRDETAAPTLAPRATPASEGVCSARPTPGRRVSRETDIGTPEPCSAEADPG